MAGDHKAGREWIAIAVSILALCVSVIGAWDAHTTTKRAEEQFNAQRSLLLVADLNNQQPPNGLIFKIHPQSSDERLEKLEIYLPSQIDANDTASTVLYNADLNFSLAPYDKSLKSIYCQALKEIPPPGQYKIARSFAFIPIGIIADYSISGQMMTKAALYHFNIDVQPSDSKSLEPCSLTYAYLSFDRDLNRDEAAKIAASQEMPEYSLEGLYVAH